MARIRSIKPELLEDEKVARLTHLEYRVFVSSFLLADDYGNFRAAPERIHGTVLWAHPREGLAKALERLAVVGLLVFYMVSDQLYIHIAGWEKHQKVDHPGKPLCPALTTDSRLSREALAKILDPLAPDQDQDHDLEEGPRSRSSLSPISEQSDPDQTRASELRANTPPRGSAYRPAPVGALTPAFLRCFERFPNGYGKNPAAGVWQDLATEHPNGEPGLERDVLAAFARGVLGRHPYNAELRFRPSFEKFLRDRLWEDPSPGHEAATPAAGFVPRPFPSAAKAAT